MRGIILDSLDVSKHRKNNDAHDHYAPVTSTGTLGAGMFYNSFP